VTVAILRNIRDEIHGLREEMNTRFVALESATARGFEAVTARLEHLRDFSGDKWRDHERRIRKLEQRASQQR
jgi:hypothetical protein